MHRILLGPHLESSSNVYTRRDAVRPPLTPPYDGPFSVLVRSVKTFTVDIGSEVICLDRLTQAFFAAIISLCPGPYNLRLRRTVLSFYSDEIRIIGPERIRQQVVLLSSRGGGAL